MACSTSTLSANLINNCRPNGQGLYEKMFSIRLSDILAVAYDSTTDTIITSFTLKSGAKFKLWEGFKLSNQRTTGFASNDYGNYLPQTTRFAVLDNSALADKEINSIVNLTDLVIVSKQAGAFGRWKVQGYPTGLACTNLEQDSNSADNPGVPVLTFTAAQARQMAFDFKHVTSSVEDTEDYLITLTTPVS